LLTPAVPAPQSIKCGELSAASSAGCKVQSHGGTGLLRRSLEKATDGDSINDLAIEQRAHR